MEYWYLLLLKVFYVQYHSPIHKSTLDFILLPLDRCRIDPLCIEHLLFHHYISSHPVSRLSQTSKTHLSYGLTAASIFDPLIAESHRNNGWFLSLRNFEFWGLLQPREWLHDNVASLIHEIRQRQASESPAGVKEGQLRMSHCLCCRNVQRIYSTQAPPA